ncbi:MAG: hypothetical protein US49_C0005G0049 [candidate division TM6 bacterium GW2011_GWF2_37_49]|nr:MAG: hypothetical protein US49_C0005G0049 [candidate division TM6 bacterium GW2011_GWF2_37_49]
MVKIDGCSAVPWLKNTHKNMRGQDYLGFKVFYYEFKATISRTFDYLGWPGKLKIVINFNKHEF